jgi:hypothetical protein
VGSLNTENLANSLWATCVFSLFLDSGLGWRWVYSGASATGPWVSLGEAACFNIDKLCQIHPCVLLPRACRQGFVWRRSSTLGL